MTDPAHPPLRHFPPSGPAAEAARAGGFTLPFSAAVRAGDVLYLSGQIGALPDGSLAEGIEAQARQAMANIGAVLGDAGLGFGDVFHCLVMLADMEEWGAFNRVYLEHFEAGRLPARSAFAAAGLALGARLEIECRAWAGGR
ncbi:MAG: 2-iminobutanoate/2-iminopropanoate deaminase [Sphingomonadales bacterium]|nr:2-iminobutanoate/2-iminopropanoate deaminase [Sphingomonadales bacterium]